MFIAHLKNGSVVKESDMDWKELKKISENFKDVTSLQIQREVGDKCDCGRDISGSNLHTLSVKGDNVELIQLKRNVLTLGIAGPKGNELVERVLGFIIKDERGNEQYAVKMVLDEKSGRVKLTLEKKMNGKWVSQ